ncbi:MAG: alpha-glucosidase, partial [Treponema sp.]|nr:alpha-glucosidase [Treponema sp.]
MSGSQWWKSAVVYQIYPRSFQDSNNDGTGDIPGIISRLDYLADLGIDVIWLSPVYKSPMVDNGYDISDYEDIDPLFGSMQDMERLLAEAHKRGIKIVMDLVVNHTSDRHPWFIESRGSRDNPKRDWYIWRDGFEGGPPNRTRSVFSGSAWEFDEKTGQYYLHFFAKQQPDLNWENPELREAVFAMMKRWLDRGVDGFRMDVISAISKHPETLRADGGDEAADWTNGPRVHDFLQEMNRKVLSGRGIMTVGETPGVSPATARLYAGFDRGELNMVFQFELATIDDDPALGKWTTKRFDLREFKRVTAKWQDGLYGAAWNSLYLENHDQPRSVARYGSAATHEDREKSAKMLAICLHFQQGTPYIYQGEELGMTNFPWTSLSQFNDVEIFNARKELVEEKKALSGEAMMAGFKARCRDNARTPMQWDSSPNAGFTKGKPWLEVNPNYQDINAEKQRDDPDSIFHFYKKIIALRRQCPVIIEGRYEL